MKTNGADCKLIEGNKYKGKVKKKLKIARS